MLLWQQGWCTLSYSSNSCARRLLLSASLLAREFSGLSIKFITQGIKTKPIPPIISPQVLQSVIFLKSVIQMTTTNNPYFYKEPCQDPNSVVHRFEEESELAKELKRRKIQQESKKRSAEQVIADSQEIKKLRQLVQLGYLNKERSKQLAEKQVRAVDDLMKEAELEVDLLRKRDEEERRLREVEAEKARARVENKALQQRQIDEKKLKEIEAQEQYLKQKDQIEAILRNMLAADRKEMEDNEKKKKKALEDMNVALEFKATKKREEQTIQKMETAKYMQYIKDLDKREEGVKVARQEKEAAKQVIFEKLKAQEERRRKDEEDYENLKRELYQEELEADIRRKNREQAEKKQRQKYEIQQAQVEAKERKRLQKVEEGKLEEQFRRTMLEKFANDDKLEQLAQQKRRLKEQEHKREVERLWLEKLEAFRLQQDRQEEEKRKGVEQQYWKDEIIRQEKERIIRENLPYLEGFAPKDLIKVSEGTFQSSGGVRRTGYADKFKLT